MAFDERHLHTFQESEECPVGPIIRKDWISLEYLVSVRPTELLRLVLPDKLEGIHRRLRKPRARTRSWQLLNPK
jgi:hypothetical protein